MTSKGWVAVFLPMLVGMALLGIDTLTGFEVTESQYNLVVTLVGLNGSLGVANGYRKYRQLKEIQEGSTHK